MSTATQPAVSAEFAVAYRDMLLDSLANKEFPVTSKVIRAIPQAKSSYKPDDKAKTAIELAWHIASAEVWFLDSIADGKFEPGAENKPNPGDITKIADWYDVETKRAAARVKKLSAADLVKPVDFYGAFQLPNFAYLQFELNHGVHHRGQLSTYLRPMGSKIPSIYGGSADEPWQG